MQQVSQSAPLFESHLRGLKKIHQGKVRDIYDVDAEHLLIVTTDRLSAFDVVLPDPIPFKGEVLTQISLFWFAKTRHMIANHLSALKVEDVVADSQERAQLAGRAMVVKKLRALPIEAVVRGYLIGSGYKDYKLHGSVCGIALPGGLRMADPLPEPLFTPASKAPATRWWAWSDVNTPTMCGASRSTSIDSLRSTPARARSSSPIPNSNSASTRRVASCSSTRR